MHSPGHWGGVVRALPAVTSSLACTPGSHCTGKVPSPHSIGPTKRADAAGSQRVLGAPHTCCALVMPGRGKAKDDALFFSFSVSFRLPRRRTPKGMEKGRFTAKSRDSYSASSALSSPRGRPAGGRGTAIRGGGKGAGKMTGSSLWIAEMP